MYGNKHHNSSIVKQKQQFILLTTNFFTIMNMEKEMMYVAPVVEVLEVEVEKGFEVSNPDATVDGDVTNPFE